MLWYKIKNVKFCQTISIVLPFGLKCINMKQSNMNTKKKDMSKTSYVEMRVQH